MPHSLSIALVASLCLALTAKAEDKPSPAVKRILDKAVAEVKKNCQAFDKANAKPLGDARSALEELSKQQTSDGKTKDAIATLQQAETLERDVMAMVSGGKPTLSPAVKPILDQAVLGVMANRQALQKANETPLSDARSALEELAKKQTKDGKTKDAIATLQQVETLERDVMAMAKAPAPVAGAGRPAQKKPLLERIAGRWVNPERDYHTEIDDKGTYREVKKNNGSVQASGNLQIKSEEVATTRLSNGWGLNASLAEKDGVLVITNLNAKGEPVGDEVWFRAK